MNPKRDYSEKLWPAALRLIPGGVNSPVRAFGGVGGTPFFTRRAKGARLWDVDGNEYVDYVGSWGPMILGHAPGAVVRAIQEAARDGTSFGTPHPREIRLAQLVCESFPSVAKVRFVNSGTEATMSAIRLARGFTKRDPIVKFAGCYHGHADPLLVKAGSGAATFDVPDSAGVPADFARHTVTLPLNDLAALDAVDWGAIACAIIEPIPANMGLIPLRPGFLEKLRDLTRRHGALLVFDEVISGFRVARGGAQELLGLRPDLTTLGKIIGGGLPVGAFGGRAEIMDLLAPTGPVYQAGTLSGNPLAMAAGIATLEELFGASAGRPAVAGMPVGDPGTTARPPAWPKPLPRGEDPAVGPYQRLEEATAYLCTELGKLAAAAKVPVRQYRIGSIFCHFFTDHEVVDYASAKTSDTKRYAKFFHAMLDRGVYLAPSQFEVGFVSLAHSEADLEQTLRAAAEAFKTL